MIIDEGNVGAAGAAILYQRKTMKTNLFQGAVINVLCDGETLFSAMKEKSTIFYIYRTFHDLSIYLQYLQYQIILVVKARHMGPNNLK